MKGQTGTNGYGFVQLIHSHHIPPSLPMPMRKEGMILLGLGPILGHINLKGKRGKKDECHLGNVS
jgi:hypothetical protein